VRNLSYERRRTEKEQKQEDLKEPKTVVDILKRGYATHDGITQFFVALARGAGFTSSVLFVSSRENQMFDREILSFWQLDSELALVRLNGKPIFLDPGTRFCPYGLLRWMRSGTASMDTRDPGNLINTPGAGGESATISRSGDLKLDPDGSLKGQVWVEFAGGEAVERRISALDTDDAGRKKEIEEEVKQWLPVHSKAELTGDTAWDDGNSPLTFTLDIQVPEYASVAGKRLLVPFGLFQPKRTKLLKSTTRKYPIYFHYAFSERDNLTITIPEGYTVETMSAAQTAKTSYSTYQSKAELTGKRLQLERTLFFNGVFLQPERYAELREFLGKVQAADESQTVLRQGAGEGQKPN
jgi:hypothetical protein